MSLEPEEQNRLDKLINYCVSERLQHTLALGNVRFMPSVSVHFREREDKKEQVETLVEFDSPAHTTTL